MKRNVIAKGSSLGLLLFVFASLVPAAFGQTKDSSEVTGLLTETKSEAIQLKDDAEQLKAFSRSQLHWTTHAKKVDEIKQHVNKSGELLTKMTNARVTASPWQQQAIDRIEPMLKDLAATVGSTIDQINKHPEHLQISQYREFVDANAALATNLSEVISDFVEYGKSKNKSEELAQALEVSGN